MVSYDNLSSNTVVANHFNSSIVSMFSEAGVEVGEGEFVEFISGS